jgi:hypothetical protein
MASMYIHTLLRVVQYGSMCRENKFFKQGRMSSEHHAKKSVKSPKWKTHSGDPTAAAGMGGS